MTVSTPEMLPAAPEAASEGSNKKVLVAGALAAAVALGGAGYFLLLSGGDDTIDQSMGTAVTRSVPTTKKVAPRTAPAKKTTKAATVPVVSKVPLGRDPFRALYILPAAPAASTTAPVTPTTTTPTVTSPTTSGGTTSGSASGGSTTTTAPKSYALTLKRVYGSGSQRTAEFVVGGKTMLAKIGSVFGPTSELKLLSLSQAANGDWVATLQVGDDEPFDAAEGERLYVK